MVSSKRESRLRRHARIKKNVQGTPDKPRLSVYRSNVHIYAQLIDDIAGRTLASASSLEGDVDPAEDLTKTDAAHRVGERLAERANEAGVQTAVFDRGGFRYAGRVKALAEGAREGGLDL